MDMLCCQCQQCATHLSSKVTLGLAMTPTIEIRLTDSDARLKAFGELFEMFQGLAEKNPDDPFYLEMMLRSDRNYQHEKALNIKLRSL